MKLRNPVDKNRALEPKALQCHIFGQDKQVVALYFDILSLDVYRIADQQIALIFEIFVGRAVRLQRHIECFVVFPEKKEDVFFILSHVLQKSKGKKPQIWHKKFMKFI